MGSSFNACNRVGCAVEFGDAGEPRESCPYILVIAEQGIYERWSIDTAAKAFVSMPPLMPIPCFAFHPTLDGFRRRDFSHSVMTDQKSERDHSAVALGIDPGFG